jgi:hypothetical protein
MNARTAMETGSEAHGEKQTGTSSLPSLEALLLCSQVTVQEEIDSIILAAQETTPSASEAFLSSRGSFREQ